MKQRRKKKITDLEPQEVTKNQLIEIIARKTGNTEKATAEIINSLLSAVTEQIQDGHKVVLQGFGTFLIRSRVARRARNPRTGENIQLPSMVYPDFSAGKTFKRMVKDK